MRSSGSKGRCEGGLVRSSQARRGSKGGSSPPSVSVDGRRELRARGRVHLSANAWLRPLALLLAGAVELLPPGAGAGEAPFSTRTVHVPGRPVEAFALPGPQGARLVVLSVEGSPPDERRHVNLLLPPAGATPAEPRGFVIRDEVVALDAGDFDPAPGPEALLITARELRIVALGSGTARRVLPLRPALPLPPRTRQISRLRTVRDWEGSGRAAALLPTVQGALLVPLDGRPPRALPLPVLTQYETLDPRRPIYEGYMTARLVWPALGQADDDGDGKLDLFAATRYHLWVFRAGPLGLAAAPSRRARFAPFAFEDERRHRSYTLRAYFRDLDGDGRAEVIEHRSGGTLLSSHATTRVFAGGPSGADPSGPPSSELREERGFAGIEILDLDGDGRLEILQNVVPFGLMQLARVLTTRRVESELRVLHFPDGATGEARESWRTELRFPLDFSAQRIQGLLPSALGDWNGDGLRDLIHGKGPHAVVIRLGERSPEGPRFGSAVAQQRLPFSDLAVIADLDGDGLDDLVTYDTLDAEGGLHLAINRGRLPGTPPRFVPAP